MEIKIFGKEIKSEQDFHIQFAKSLGIEQYYGKNIHALWDVLSMGVERPLQLIWYDSDFSREKLGNGFNQILEVLERTRIQDESYGWINRFTYALL